MLYEFHDMQRAILAPLTATTGWVSQWYSHPYSPLAYLPMAPEIAAGAELLHRLGKDYDKPEWQLPTTSIDGRDVAVTPVTVLRHSFCTLLHFEREVAGRNDPKVLLVAPLSGHYATLLRDTVRALLPAHDVYVTDWADARTVPLNQGPFHLDDYVGYVRTFIQRLAPDLHVIAVCQPTVPVLAAVALMAADNDPARPRTMTMMGGPIDPRQAPTEVNKLAITKPYAWFEDQLIYRVPARYPGAGRRVYPGFLQHAGFVAMNPDRHLNSHYDFYLDLMRGDDSDAQAHRRFYDEYNAVLDMPAEYYLDTIRVVFQEHRLPRGIWVVDGKPVNPAAIIDTALLTIEGELDDISGQGQTRAAQQLCAGLPAALKQHYTAQGSGHYGIFSGRRWRETICPRIAAFIHRHA
jgi:poly(3-hydroxybutyrate) depolymerase